MEIRAYTDYDEQEIRNLYDSVGWTAYTDDMASLKEGFSHSLLTLAAYEGSTLLGLIRTVGDGATIVLVQDILVLPEYQRQGIGSRLLQAVLNRFASVRQIQLVTDQTEKTMAFYRSMGFEALDKLGCCALMKV